jgi:hypothetical protein
VSKCSNSLKQLDVTSWGTWGTKICREPQRVHRTCQPFLVHVTPRSSCDIGCTRKTRLALAGSEVWGSGSDCPMQQKCTNAHGSCSEIMSEIASCLTGEDTVMYKRYVMHVQVLQTTSLPGSISRTLLTRSRKTRPLFSSPLGTLTLNTFSGPVTPSAAPTGRALVARAGDFFEVRISNTSGFLKPGARVVEIVASRVLLCNLVETEYSVE